MEYIVLFFLLQVKHYWADFVIQTYQQTVRKGIYRDLVGISHSVDHVCGTLVALLIFNFIHPLSAWTILILSLAEGMLHYHIDWIKVRYGCKDITKPMFWNQFGQDQLAHQITYIALTAYLLPL